MTKTIFLIPGFKTQIADARYQWLVSYVKSKDYVVYPVPIVWNNRTVTQNAQEFIDFFESKNIQNSYILGFSYGAVIALTTATKTAPKKLILCSLSPDFLEDAAAMSDWHKSYIGDRRYADVATRSAVELTTSLQSNTVLFCGEKEGADYPQLQIRSQETAKLAQYAKLIMVENAPHDISFPTYRAAIQKEL
jgi:esterase/lipase